MSRWFLGMHSFLSHCKHPDVEAACFYHFWCNAGERGQSTAHRWGQDILALRSIPCSKQKSLSTVCKLQRLFKWTLNGARKGTLQRVATSGCGLGCFTALRCGHFLRVWLYIFTCPNFGAMGSATNNKIEIGKENAVGCVLCPEESVIRQCTGKRIKQKKIRSPIKKETDKERLCISGGEIWYVRSSEERFLPLCATRCGWYLFDLHKEMGQLKGIWCCKVKRGD